MPSVRPTVKARRIAGFLSDCTVSVYLRRGAAWDAVAVLRSHLAALDIAVRVGIPVLDADRTRTEFWHTKLIPADGSLDVEPWRGVPMLPWVGVVNALVYYDPPGDHLLDYADRLMAMLARHDRTRDSTPEVAALPIRYLTEPDDVQSWWRRHEREMLWRLRDRLADRGIEIDSDDWQALCLDTERDLCAGRAEESKAWGNPYGPARPFIVPNAPKADVIAAYDHLAATGALSGAKGAPDGRPPPDPLVCVQCAVWHDQARLSYAEIGSRMGWKVQRPPGHSPRCETARQHVERGREIIQHENVAA